MSPVTRRSWFVHFFIIFFVIVTTGCSGPEEKKMKFYSKGKALFDKGDLVKARLELKNAVQIDPKYDQAYYLLGMVELKQGNFSAAFTDFSKVVTVNPHNLDAQVQLGKLFMMQGSREKAQELATLVLKAKPDHEEGSLLQGALYLAAKDPNRTIRLLMDMNKKGVRRPDLYMLLSAAQHEAGNEAGTEQALIDGIRQNGNSLMLHRSLADFHASRGNTGAAADQILQMVRLDPADYSLIITLAGLHWNTGSHAKSREILRTLQAANPDREDIADDVAAFFRAKGDLAEGESSLRTAIAKNGASFRLRWALGDLLVKGGRGDEGIKILKECLAMGKGSKSPEIIKTKNLLAQIHLGKGEILEADRLVEEVLKEKPRDPDANLAKGRLFLLKGDGAKAVMVFRTVVSDNPKQLQGHLLLAQAHVVNNDLNLALETLQQARRFEPEAQELQRAMARYYLLKKDWPTAEEYLQTALAKNPQDTQLLLDMGDVSKASGNFNKAEKWYKAVRASSTGAVIGRIKLSEVYAAKGQPQLATEQLSQALDLAADSDDVLARLVKLYRQQNKTAAAIEVCRRQIAKKPRALTPYFLLGELLAEEGRIKEAEEALIRAGKMDSDGQQSNLQLAQLYVKTGEKNKARIMFENVLAKNPGSVVAANDFACLLADSGDRSDLKKAFKLAQEVCDRHPDNPLFMDTLGWVYYRKGKFEDAAELLEKAAVKLSEYPVVRYHAGAAQYRAGKTGKAREHLETAAKSKNPFPGKDEAVALLKKL